VVALNFAPLGREETHLSDRRLLVHWNVLYSPGQVAVAVAVAVAAVGGVELCHSETVPETYFERDASSWSTSSQSQALGAAAAAAAEWEHYYDGTSRIGLQALYWASWGKVQKKRKKGSHCVYPLPNAKGES
jgi:hypothetical protein